MQISSFPGVELRWNEVFPTERTSPTEQQAGAVSPLHRPRRLVPRYTTMASPF